MTGMNLSRKYKLKEVSFVSSLILVGLLFYLLYSPFVYEVVSGDSVSYFYPAKALIEKNNLNMWDSYNYDYRTYYFKLPFTDEVIVDYGHSYPSQTPFTIFTSAMIIALGGTKLFFYFNLIFASLVLIIMGLITKKITKSEVSIILSIILFMTFPVFVFWSVIPQNIMLGLLFFLISFYLLILYGEKDNKYLIFFSGLFLGFAISLKPFLGILLLPNAAYMYILNRNSLKKFFKVSGIFLSALIFIGASNLLFNLVYFDNPLFLGYISGDYHPVSPDFMEPNIPQISSKLISLNINLSNLKDAVEYFIRGYFKYSSLFFFITLISLILFILKIKDKKLIIFSFLSLAIFLVYLSSIKNLLWSPVDPAFAYSLSLVFFRYILPVITLLGLFSALFWENFLRLPRSKYIKLFLVFLIAILMIINYVAPIKYAGGASLNWVSEINPKIIEYSSTFQNITQEGSVILYPQRHEVSFLYPDIERYHLFYYDGIPPNYRINETKRVVSELIRNNVTVYMGIYGDPYNATLLNKKENDPNIDEVAAALDKDFEFIAINGSYFDRLKFQLYEIKNET